MMVVKTILAFSASIQVEDVNRCKALDEIRLFEKVFLNFQFPLPSL